MRWALVGRWASGRALVGRRAGGPMGRWADGPMGRWAGGRAEIGRTPRRDRFISGSRSVGFRLEIGRWDGW